MWCELFAPDASKFPLRFCTIIWPICVQKCVAYVLGADVSNFRLILRRAGPVLVPIRPQPELCLSLANPPTNCHKIRVGCLYSLPNDQRKWQIDIAGKKSSQRGGRPGKWDVVGSVYTGCLVAELKSVLGLLAWLITDINGISHANLILRIRHVCVVRVPLTKFAMFVRVCECV